MVVGTRRGQVLGVTVGSAMAGAVMMLFAAPYALADDATQLITLGEDYVNAANSSIKEALQFALQVPAGEKPDINEVVPLQIQLGFQDGQFQLHPSGPTFLETVSTQITGSTAMNVDDLLCGMGVGV